MIYGGSSAGIAAAVQVKRMGGSVVIIEPTQRIGGLTTGGLGQTDIGNKQVIGGTSAMIAIKDGTSLQKIDYQRGAKPTALICKPSPAAHP